MYKEQKFPYLNFVRWSVPETKVSLRILSVFKPLFQTSDAGATFCYHCLYIYYVARPSHETVYLHGNTDNIHYDSEAFLPPPVCTVDPFPGLMTVTELREVQVYELV